MKIVVVVDLKDLPTEVNEFLGSEGWTEAALDSYIDQNQEAIQEGMRNAAYRSLLDYLCEAGS